MTLAQLEALEERREIELRHLRFNAALVACAIWNSQRPADSDAEPLSPFDYLAGFETDPEEVERQKIRRSIRRGVALTLMGMKDKPRDEILAKKAEMIERMKANGVDDPEGLIREVFPEL